MGYDKAEVNKFINEVTTEYENMLNKLKQKDADIAELNIPTGVPLVYELDSKLQPIDKKHYYLGDQDEINASINAVKNQDSAKAK